MINNQMSKIELKVTKLLKNMDLREGTMVFNKLLNEGVAMRQFGLTWKEIDKGLSDKLELIGLWACDE